MAFEITITSIEKIEGSSNFNVYFTSNYQLSDLKAQYSTNGVNWSSNIQLNTSSPQQVAIPLNTSFYLRLNDDTQLTQNRKHTNQFNLKYS